MRHGKKVNPVGRKKAHRKALLMNLSNQLIEYKRINTTLAKAKALRKHVEPIITKAKTNTTHSRRVVFSYLQDKERVTELFAGVIEKIGDRPGGYLRIIKTGFRQGDGAEMAMIEFVDYNDVYVNDGASDSGAGSKKKKSRRRRRGGSKKAAATGAAVGTAAAVAASTTTEVEETVTEVVEDTLVTETVTETVVENVGDMDPELQKLQELEGNNEEE